MSGFSKVFFSLNSLAMGTRACLCTALKLRVVSTFLKGLKDNNLGLGCMWPTEPETCATWPCTAGLPADPSLRPHAHLCLRPSCCGLAAGTCLAARGAQAWPPGPQISHIRSLCCRAGASCSEDAEPQAGAEPQHSWALALGKTLALGETLVRRDPCQERPWSPAWMLWF